MSSKTMDLPMNYPAASSGLSTRHSGKPEGLIRNLDSRFRGNDSNAASGGVLNPGFAIKGLDLRMTFAYLQQQSNGDLIL